MHSSREAKLRHFFSLAQEGQSILDLGVSAEPPGAYPLLNYFFKNYKYAPDTYTGLGVQDLSSMSEKYPGNKFLTYDGRKLPFKDKQFDWVFSNAVIEHVGYDKDQLFFLNEMLRVSKRVFFTTPNKYFPVESHSNIIFLHWNNSIFYRLAKKKNGLYWTQENLYLFSRRQLKNLLSQSNAEDYTLQSNRQLGLAMTFTVVCSSP